MREFARYTALVVKYYFNGLLAWALNFVTLVSLFVSIKFPVFPIWIGLLFFLINTFLATFLVWQKEVERACRLEARLEEIENARPKYKTSVGNVKRYTVQNLIEAAAKEVVSLRQKIENAKNPTPVPASRAFGGLSSGIKALRQMQGSVLPAMRSFGYDEDDEDKLERLEAYHAELLEYESKLKNLFQLGLSVESSRYDKNVEIEIESSDTDAMIVQDDYERDGLPIKERQSHSSLLSPMDLGSVPHVDKYYLRSFAADNKAVSELTHINAQRPTGVFDSTFYICSKKKRTKLTIKVRSTKLTEPQVIEEVVDLTDLPVIQVSSYPRAN